MASLDWAGFEQELHEELRRALARVARAHRGQAVYALALHGIYRELDRTISLPTLALATEDDGAPPDDEGFWGARWNPPDWDEAEIELRQRPASKLQRALDAEATRSTQAHFGRVEQRYFALLVRVVKRLRDDAAQLLTLTDDFVAYVFDPEGGPELARKSIPKARFERLFAVQVAVRQEQAALAARPVAERAAFLVTRFSCFEGVTTEMAQKELLSIGEAAVPALLTVVGDRKDGWTAAKVLGQIGAATPAVIEALRPLAKGSHWHASALGMLGDLAWLAEQAPAAAVPGLCARLRAITGAWRPLDYRPLERYLDGAKAAVRRKVEELLSAGSSYVAIQPSDVTEALRGLRSKHDVIRWHAAAVLRDRSLGKDASKQVPPALAEALTDAHPLVRRIAGLSLSHWPGAKARYRAGLEALLDDPDEVVRRIAAHILS